MYKKIKYIRKIRYMRKIYIYIYKKMKIYIYIYIRYKKNKIRKIAAEQNSITSLAWIVSFNM